jgi:hypothetical protein
MGPSNLTLCVLATTGALGFALLSCARGSDGGGIAGGAGGTGGTGGQGGSSSVSSGGLGVTSASTSAGGAGASGPSSPCDVTDCGDCGCCAENSVCMNPLNECLNDNDCIVILGCVEGCPDNACAEQCVISDPGEGATLFNTLNTCLECACVQSCAIPASVCP